MYHDYGNLHLDMMEWLGPALLILIWKNKSTEKHGKEKTHSINMNCAQRSVETLPLKK